MKKKSVLIKKSVFIWFALLMATMLALSLTACSKSSTIPSNKLLGYDFSDSTAYGEMPDEHVYIDGKLNEPMWQQSDYWVHSDPSVNGVTLHVTTHFSPKGLYIGAYSEDRNVYFNGRNFRNHNTNFNFLIAFSSTATSAAFVDILIDSNSVFPGITRVNARSAVLGKEVNTGESDGLSVEMFMTWDDLGVKIKSDENGEPVLPERIYMQTRYRYVLDQRGTSSQAVTIRPTLAYTTLQVADFADFGKNGYLTADETDAKVGDAISGFAKSGGWDIAAEADGTVRSTKGYYQAIFFRSGMANNFVMKTKLKFNASLTNQLGAKAGLITYKDMMNYRAVTIDFDSSNVSRGRAIKSKLFTATHYPAATYVLDALSEGNNISYAGSNDMTELTVIKNDADFYYIVNGKFIASEKMEYMNGVAAAGLYSMHGEIEFTDYEFKSFDNDNAALSEEINTYCYKVGQENNGRFTGGKLSLDKTAVDKGGNAAVRVNVTTDSGYKLTDITLNSVSILDKARSSADARGFVLSGIYRDAVLGASFERISAESAVTIFGSAKGSNGLSMGGQVSVEAFEPNGTPVKLYYLSTTFASSRYEFNVVKEYKYTLRIAGSGHRVLVKDLGKLDGDVSVETNSSDNLVGGMISKRFELPAGYTPNALSLNVSSNPMLWDLSRDNEGIAEFNYTSGTTTGAVYFSDSAGYNFVAEATITNITKKNLFGDYETDPAAGFVVNNGRLSTTFYLWQSGLRIMDGDFYTRTDARSLSPGNTVNEIGKATTLKLIRYNGVYYVFINGKYVYRREDRHLVTSVTKNGQITSINSPVAVGFGLTTSFPLSVQFRDYSVKFDDEAMDDIRADIFAEITKGEGMGNLTLSGVDQNGWIVQGEQFTVSANIAGNEAYIVKVATQENDYSTYILTKDAPTVTVTAPISQKITLTAQKKDSVGKVTAKVNAGGSLRSDAKLYVRWDGGKGEMTVPYTDSGYSVTLPYGDYEMEAFVDGFYSQKKTVTVNDAQASVAFSLGKSVLGGSVKLGGLTYSTTDNWIKSGDTLQVMDRKSYTYTAYFSDFVGTQYVASVVTRISTDINSPYYSNDNVQGLTFVGAGNVIHIELNGAGFRIMKDVYNAVNMVETVGTDWNFFFDMTKAEQGNTYVDVRMTAVRDGNRLLVYVGPKEGKQTLYLILDSENGVTPVGENHKIAAHVSDARVNNLKELLRQSLSSGIPHALGYTLHMDTSVATNHNNSMIYGASVSSSAADIKAFLDSEEFAST